MLPYLFLINGGDFVSREIKFRVWNEELEEMYELRKANYLGSTGIIDPYTGGDKSIWQQYTGLKDKNDVEIYEGDIVTYVSVYKWNKKLQKSVVTFSNGMFNPGSVIGWGKDGTREVIGNIYENPELLEATK